MKKNMAKFLILLVLMLTAIIGVSVVAQAETYGGTAKGTKWSVDTTTGVLTIDVEGPMGSWTQGSQPWYKYRTYITSIEFPQATSKITNYAFSDLVNLKIIEIPNSVEEVGTNAFINCSAATELYIPISVATWGGYVFQNCVSVDYIYTENQANISQTAPIWDASVGKSAAEGKVELQIESKSIGAYSFYGLSSVTDVKLPTTLTSINDYAFYGFTSPFALDLKSATSIGEYAFYQCTGVTSINLPVATEIGANAFYGCTGAKSINLPVATTIGDNAFQNCSGATSISVGATSVDYGSNVFAGCSGCTDLYLGSIAFESGSNALNGLGTKSGVTVTLGKSISTINGTLQSTHIGSTGAMDLKLEENSALTSIGTSAFENNSMLRSVDLSNRNGSLTIGAKAFNNCSKIQSFATSKGRLTLSSLSCGNLVNLESMQFNAETTVLGWAPANITTTRTLSQSGNAPLTISSASALSATTDNAWTENNITYKYVTAVTYKATVETTYNASLQYEFSGENTSTHPFLNMGKNTEKGTAVSFGGTVKEVPSYLFTSGIQMVETSSGQQTTTTSGSIGSFTVEGNKVKDSAGNAYTLTEWYYSSGANWLSQTISQKGGTLTLTGTVTYAVTKGTKASYPTGIKIAQMDFLSKNLVKVGQNVSGTINYDLATTSAKVNPLQVTSGNSATLDIVGASLSVQPKYPHITFRHDIDSAQTTGTTNYSVPVYYGTSSPGGNWQKGYIAAGSYTSSNRWHYQGYFGFVSATKAVSAVNNLLGTISGDGTASINSTSEKDTTSGPVLSSASYANATLINDGCKTLNISVAAPQSIISDYAFAGNSSVTNVYLASTIATVAQNAFYTRTAAGDMYIYGHTNSDPIASQPGISTNNSYTVHYEPNLKDLGIFIEKFQVGDNVYGYLYNTSGDEYLVNLAGSGVTYETFTQETHPGWFDSYGSKVKKVIVDDTVTSIGQYLFYGHTGLEAVELGSGVTSIGDYAFADCSILDEGALQFTSPVAKIGIGAFANTATTKVVIPSSITTLGGKIFAGCELEAIAYNATAATDLDSKDVQPFTGLAADSTPSIAIGSNVTKVPKFMFYDCPADSVFIGAGVAEIGIGAFGSMNNVSFAVDAGNAKYTVGGDGNLYSDAATTMVVYKGSLQDEYYSLPVTVTSIAAGAFYGQDYLLQVSFDATITTIGAQAFDSCAKLETIAVSDFMDEDSFNAEVVTGERWSGDATVIFSGLVWDIGVTKGALTATLYSDGTLAIVGEGAMKNWASAASVDWYAKRGNITKVTFEGTPTSIGAYAFSGCDKLTTCVMPDTIDTIGQYAFYDCKSLQSMRVPDKVTKIETYTFGNCENMVWLDGGRGLTTIEPFAFTGCTNTRYISLNSTVMEVKDNAFTGDKNLTILIAGKQDKTDFDNYAGIPTEKGADYFRICYMPEATNTRLLKRFAGNNSTGLYSGYAVETDLWAYSFDTDNDGVGDYLHIAGQSAMEPSWNSQEAVPWHKLRESLTKVYIEDDVTSVGPYAFEDCTKLTYVKMGKQCATLSTHSFYNCSALETLMCNVEQFTTGSLTAESAVFEKAGSENGFTVVFEDDVARIPGYMFYNCENLTNLTIGKAVSSINSHAFAGCTGLKTVYLKGSNITSTDSNVFTNAGSLSGGFTVEVASNVTKIPDSLFYSDTANPYVTSVFVDAGSKLETIGARAFKGCNRLESANFANCSVLAYVQNGAFADCTRLVTVDLSNCVELLTIASEAFQNCMNLADLSIDNDEKLHEIGANAFKGCVGVRDIVLPGSVEVVGSEAFGGWVREQIIYVLDKLSQSDFDSATSSWSGNATVIYTKLSWDMSKEQDGSIMAYYTVPDAGQVNNEYCIFVVGKGEMKDFQEQNAINWPGIGSSTDIRETVTRIYISDGITRVGNYNFAGFTNSTSLSLGSSISEIGMAAFKDDRSIPEVDLSPAAANLTMIENSAFENCSGVSTVNLSGCDALESVGNDAFKQLAGSSSIYVSSEFLYDMLANTNGNIKSTYGTTANTKIVTVRVTFTQNLVSQGVRNNTQVVWHVEATANDNLSFTWYYATEKGGQWTEITSAMTGYSIQSTTKESTLTMDPSIVTLDKNGWYFMVEAESPYYNEASNQAALAVYSSAITPVITVVDKNGDSLESNTWTQGPVTIYITEGTASNGITPSYQYKLKASGTWRNTEPKMLYNTEGIVTFYCRAIINGDSNTASEPVKYILKLDNTNPEVSISADPEFESTESVDLTATANDQTSGVASIGWYKTAADANDEGQNSGVTGYVPLLPETDMNVMALTVDHFKYVSTEYKVDKYTTTYTGKNEEHSANLNLSVDIGEEADTIANFTAAKQAVTDKEISKFELYEVHVMNGEGEDYAISASNKGVVTIPIPAGYDTNHLAVYQFNKTGILTPITNFSLNTAKTNVTFSVPSFGQYIIAEKAVSVPVEEDMDTVSPAA